MKLVVLSGKGGTGKTSLTSSLALSLSRKRKLVLVDADADCPNQGIMFKGKKILDKEISVLKTAVIDYKKCNSCMLCVKNCVFHAIEVKNGKPVIKFDKKMKNASRQIEDSYDELLEFLIEKWGDNLYNLEITVESTKGHTTKFSWKDRNKRLRENE